MKVVVEISRYFVSFQTFVTLTWNETSLNTIFVVAVNMAVR